MERQSERGRGRGEGEGEEERKKSVPNSGDICRYLDSMKMRFHPGRKMSTAPGMPRP
jgi:hypothetical protein